jgi:hypothetical protein
VRKDLSNCYIVIYLYCFLYRINRSFGPFELPIYFYGSDLPVFTLATGVCEEEKNIKYSNWTRDINLLGMFSSIVSAIHPSSLYLVSGTFICTILTQINRLAVSTFREENGTLLLKQFHFSFLRNLYYI